MSIYSTRVSAVELADSGEWITSKTQQVPKRRTRRRLISENSIVPIGMEVTTSIGTRAMVLIGETRDARPSRGWKYSGCTNWRPRRKHLHDQGVESSQGCLMGLQKPPFSRLPGHHGGLCGFWHGRRYGSFDPSREMSVLPVLQQLAEDTDRSR